MESILAGSDGGGIMFDVRRPNGWLFYLLSTIFLSSLVSMAQGPALTTVSDIVYRADGVPASGTLLISWPAFSTANGLAVAAGVKSAVLGAGGALSAQLAPNVGATPSGSVYTVVYQLSDGEVKTEYWSVATTSPTTIAAIRTVLGASNSISQFATQQFVNAALASKADEAAVVHIGRTETITGLKQFTLSPRVPTPQSTTDATNKAYVDAGLAGKSISSEWTGSSGRTRTIWREIRSAKEGRGAFVFRNRSIAMTDAVASRHIVDETKFREGINKVIDGTVECLNASAWKKSEPTPTA